MNNPRSPKNKIYQAIAFDPHWLDERGWMTKAPLGIPMQDYGLIAPANIGMGFYTAKRHFNGRRPDDEVVLRFTIARNLITQELPHGRSLVRTAEHVDLYTGTGDEYRLQETWRPFVDFNGDHVWRMTSQARFVEMLVPTVYVPATLGGYVGDLADLLQNKVPPSVSAALPAMLWLSAVAVEDFPDDDPYQSSPNRWKTLPPTASLEEMYRSIRKHLKDDTSMDLEFLNRMTQQVQTEISAIRPERLVKALHVQVSKDDPNPSRTLSNLMDDFGKRRP